MASPGQGGQLDICQDEGLPTLTNLDWWTLRGNCETSSKKKKHPIFFSGTNETSFLGPKDLCPSKEYKNSLQSQTHSKDLMKDSGK
jgi:hypothetical protein